MKLNTGHTCKCKNYLMNNIMLVQIERWAKQYIASTGEGKPVGNPKMFELIDWLRQHIPLEDSRAVTTGLVHGDFRIDNLVFHPIEVWYFKSLKLL